MLCGLAIPESSPLGNDPYNSHMAMVENASLGKTENTKHNTSSFPSTTPSSHTIYTLSAGLEYHKCFTERKQACGDETK